jgi:hypothetical protein
VSPYLKELKFRFDDDWYFVLSPQHYLIDGNNMGMNGFCVIGIQGGVDDESPYILGNVFLKNFYMIYDLDKKKVGMAIPKISSIKVEEHDRGWTLPIIVVVIVVVGIVIGIVIYKKKKESRDDAMLTQ